jgi:hypothetical protein
LTTLASADFTYEAITIAILSSSEQGLAITAGNLATLRPLFTRGLGLWSSHNTWDNSGGNGPPTIGALDRAKGRAGSHTASVGLATFMRGGRDDMERGQRERAPGDEDGLSQDGVIVTTDMAISKQKSNSIWCSSSQDDNESKEELTSKPSRDTLDETTKTVPTSFLSKKGGLRDSAET